MLRAFFRGLASIATDRLKTFIFIVGAGAVVGFGAKAGEQLYAEAVYLPAWATITGTGWNCALDGEPARRCSRAELEADKIEGSERAPRLVVAVRYHDSHGTEYTRTMSTAWTGLTADTAKPGVTFGLLYDPANPKTVSTRFGAEWRSNLIPVIGIVLLVVSFLWWRHDRRKAKAAKAPAPIKGPVFAADGRRIAPPKS
ncbi:hypothetical protein sos41_14420 [Alphaproteobacteria bacterium SO-S41]|nr:hypothetical protein sos41_14420 [Alphaproteobacteria bacterium SO-S41]